jgi:sialidase-1
MLIHAFRQTMILVLCATAGLSNSAVWGGENTAEPSMSGTQDPGRDTTPSLSVAIVVSTGVTPVTTARDAVTVFESGKDGYNVYRIPAIIRATNGDLLAFCEAREAGDASAIDLVMKRSADHGRSWNALQVVKSKDDFRSLYAADIPVTVGNPAPVVDALDPDNSGRIWLPFTVENDRVFVTFSDNHGATWSTHREITKDVKKKDWGWYATGPVHSIQIRRGPYAGRLVVPTDHRIGADGADGGPLGAHVVYSDDHGQTWKLGAVDDTYDDGLNANETTVVELNDGRLYFNARDQNGKSPGTRGGAISRDGGLTFEKHDGHYLWFQPQSKSLDAPVVQCSVLRAASSRDGDDHDIILFSGPDEDGPTGKGRSDLRIRYSTDETKSWHDGPLLHEGPAAYSDMVRIEPHGTRIGVLFESGDRGGSAYQRIVFAEFSLSELNVP